MTADTRGADVAAVTASRQSPEEWFRLTGHVPGRMDPVNRALRWRKTHPGVADRARWFMNCHEYYSLLLSGRPVVDWSDAGAWATYDVATAAWSAEPIAETGVGPALAARDPAERVSDRAGTSRDRHAASPAGAHSRRHRLVGRVRGRGRRGQRQRRRRRHLPTPGTDRVWHPLDEPERHHGDRLGARAPEDVDSRARPGTRRRSEGSQPRGHRRRAHPAAASPRRGARRLLARPDPRHDARRPRARAVVAQDEPGAFGAALLPGVGAGVYPSVSEAVSRLVRVSRRYEPDRACGAMYWKQRQQAESTVMVS